MAVYFPNTNSLLLLPPKAGSVWLRAVLVESKVFHVILGPEELRGHGRLALYGREFSAIGAFVRHPISWYHSYWRYRSKNSTWDERWIIDADCASSSFEEFLQLVCSEHPGYLTNLFSEFTGAPENPIDYIGKTEFLVDGLLSYLNLIGERYQRGVIEDFAPRNVSGPRFSPTREHCDLVYRAEIGCYETYNYDKLPM
ncbi:hypothetical protein [uncultured Tateyamaria sp.]|uniref:hypothetical protein n=1 Tax=uncultured Tateyamaria sp. TaxID=455651 RepID=UPI002603EFDC|nr:hypothetical protein [uncultured Tateyamaria sp.]